MSSFHPFSQLTASEIRQTANVLKKAHHSERIIFKTITLLEPDKTAALKYLEAEHANEESRPHVDRHAFVAFYVAGQPLLHESVVDVSKVSIVYDKELDELVHGPADIEELDVVEAAVRSDKRYLEELSELGLKDSLVIIEPWIYGSDGVDDLRRQYQCFLFSRDVKNPDEQDNNHYAHPLAISPVVDVVSEKVTRIDYLPTGPDGRASAPGPYKAHPPNEYVSQYQKLRTDVKPLQIIQPEGASFTITQDFAETHLIEWQKWRFRVGFNQREGMVLHDVRYDGRPLFYRMALSDMNIPYGDPRRPFHKKAAFDLGDAGAGLTANDLRLGCDCLGAIHYLSSVISSSAGDVIEKNNCVCVHEQDNGIGWKHTNYRSGNAAVVRARELVLQSIMTVSNYEYILMFIFTQAGDVVYEVRATGILSTQPIDEGVKVPWGTVVHPGVLAAHHQHIFSLRIDSMIDGPNNTFTYDECVPLPRDKELNPYGTGYVTKETQISKSGGYDLDTSRNRVFKIKNADVKNPVNHEAVAFKVLVPDYQKGLADHSSYHYRRAEFSDRNFYVTKYRPHQLYAAGQYTNQSRGGDGVRTWSSEKDDILQSDIVVWVQFGINHVPRIEDFPVMPVESLKVHLRPVNFHTKNPAIDVPPAEQAVNRSTLLNRACTNGH